MGYVASTLGTVRFDAAGRSSRLPRVVLVPAIAINVVGLGSLVETASGGRAVISVRI